MTVIYIRHSCDEGEASHKHDGHINSSGKKAAKEFARSLIKKHGVPHAIYCSPFQRCRETLESMKTEFSKEPKIVMDTNLSRYFSSREKKKPSVDVSTIGYGPNIHEDWDEFKKRCKDHVKRMEKHKYYERKEIVWVLTHALVLKQVAPVFEVKLPEWMEFLYSFKVKSKDSKKSKEKQ